MQQARITGLLGVVAVFLFAHTASATKLFEISGKVGMADGVLPSGVKATLQLDLDRNGKFSKFEALTATVDDQGNYKLSYDLDPTKVDLAFIGFATNLVGAYSARGFDALLDGGPLPAIITFEREGYSTVVRQISTLFENPNLDVSLAPLQEISCGQSGCSAPSGGVNISGFSGGTKIVRGYAEAYDPLRNIDRFPGTFTDSSENLLISSGFMEIDFRDAAGNKVRTVPSPVSVRYEANPASWATLVDLVPGNDRIEVPMYSFNETTAEWVTEKDGVLQDQSGAVIAESALPEINAGTRKGPLFIAFSTSHFSTWNCDRPVQTRTCVKGRLVDAGGVALAGASVQVSGVSYTGGTAAIMTGADGFFVSDLMKSETPDEDVDRNGKKGETMMARVSARGAAGIFLGPAFASPMVQKSVGNRPSCKPQACDCADLGDVRAVFEAPRLCEVSVKVAYSGESTAGTSPLKSGDPIVDAKVRAEASGEFSVPVSAAQALCSGKTCSAAKSAADGVATFFVPVVGSADINVNVSYTLDQNGEKHSYSGSAVVAGCALGATKLASNVEVKASHVSLAALGDFIAALGPAPSVNSGSGSSKSGPAARRGCAALPGASGAETASWASLVSLVSVFTIWYRRRRG
ncbi:MAG: carboxypeptidase-like regulatory domain-containing protein [Polyangiaceae bacterium]|nr:carboxypeptidase-like regulatory domain-containing protein [Polyangiaceae bacterium]